MVGASTKAFTTDTFQDDVLSSNEPVLVDFWAEWCQPCRLIGPIVDELAEEFEGRVKVGKVDADGKQALAAQFGVSSIPTVILFQNGEPVKRLVGLRSKQDLAAAIKETLTTA